MAFLEASIDIDRSDGSGGFWVKASCEFRLPDNLTKNEQHEVFRKLCQDIACELDLGRMVI